MKNPALLWGILLALGVGLSGLGGPCGCRHAARPQEARPQERSCCPKHQPAPAPAPVRDACPERDAHAVCCCTSPALLERGAPTAVVPAPDPEGGVAADPPAFVASAPAAPREFHAHTPPFPSGPERPLPLRL